MKTKECIDPEVAEEIENGKVAWRQAGCVVALGVLIGVFSWGVASCAETKHGEIPSNIGKIGEASGSEQTGNAIDLIMISRRSEVITRRWSPRVSDQGFIANVMRQS